MKRVVLAVFFLAGCWPGNTDDILSTDCQEMGCFDRLDISIARRDGDVFPSGNYTFILAPQGGDTIEVPCTLTDKSLDDCQGDVGAVEVLSRDSAGELGVRLDFAPSSIVVQLKYEDQSFDTQTISPNYTTLTPNGPECDPVCFQATVSIEVSSPTF
ncbi:MAG: hypothetical protein GY854_07175 [Deltaproteobacteria bacterium]|nr:hypothetical protein [Deltaproteobacteria bacterium]